MSAKQTSASEDYLKAIYSLGEKEKPVTTSRLAERLKVAPASVTGMLQKLAAAHPPLVIYHKHQGVALTRYGEKVALEVIRHHRLLELFLQKSLGYGWDEVHAEADRLEHVISEEMEERIDRALGSPVTDPHGEPIPSRELVLPPSSSLPLSQLRPGQHARIERVSAGDPALLRYLDSVGLVPQAGVTAQEYSPFDDNLRIAVDGRSDDLVLGPRVTQHIFVGELIGDAEVV